jgi:hypothetical protein
LLKSREPAIHATVAAVLSAPRIVLRFGQFFNDDNTDANSQCEQQELNGLVVALCHKCLPLCFIPALYCGAEALHTRQRTR